MDNQRLAQRLYKLGSQLAIINIMAVAAVAGFIYVITSHHPAMEYRLQDTMAQFSPLFIVIFAISASASITCILYVMASKEKKQAVLPNIATYFMPITLLLNMAVAYYLYYLYQQFI